MQTENNAIANSFKWKKAATDALILASVTIVISTINMLIPNSGLGFIFWLLKFGGSITLLYFLMKNYGKLANESTFNYGVITCLFSSIICAIFSFFLMTVLFPQTVADSFNQVYEMMGSNMTEEILDMMQKLESHYAQYMFFFSLIWDFLLGLLFSAILTRGTSPKRDIFTDNDYYSNDTKSQDNEYE